MKIKRTYLPELVATRDTTREALHGLHLDTKRKRLIATNGHALVSLPVETEPTDRDGKIGTDTLIVARKAAQKVDVARGYAVMRNRAAKQRQPIPDPTPAIVRGVEERTHPFPNVEHLIPYRGTSRLKVQIAFNPTLLRKLADAIDSSSYVALAFDPADPYGAIRVYGRNMATAGAEQQDEPIAVLMPCRMP